MSWDCPVFPIDAKNSVGFLVQFFLSYAPLVGDSLQSTPNNSDETYMFMCLGRAGRFKPWFKPYFNIFCTNNFGLCHKVCCLFFMFWWANFFLFFFENLASDLKGICLGHTFILKWILCQKGCYHIVAPSCKFLAQEG